VRFCYSEQGIASAELSNLHWARACRSCEHLSCSIINMLTTIPLLSQSDASFKVTNECPFGHALAA